MKYPALPAYWPAGGPDWRIFGSSLLEHLSPVQRERLVAAMLEVERVLVASSVEIRPVDPECPDGCMPREYVAELNRRSTRPFDPNVGASAHPDEVRPPAANLRRLRPRRADGLWRHQTSRRRAC